MLKAVTSSITVILATVVSMSAMGAEGGPELGSSVQHFTVKTLNPKLSGQRMVSSRHLLGDKARTPVKAVGMTFGASYCEPCKKELRVLAKYAARIEKRGFKMLSVVIDKEPKGVEIMRKLLVDELKVSFPVLSDRFGILAKRYKATTLPMMVVIEPHGKISWVHSGYKKESIKSFLSKLGITDKELEEFKIAD